MLKDRLICVLNLPKGLFIQSVGQVSDKYTVYITPAGFTFTIWSVIYIFLGAGAIYCKKKPSTWN